MLSAVLFTLGLLMIVFSRKIGDLSYKIQKPILKTIIGGFLDLEKPWLNKLYRLVTVIVGIIAIILAFLEYIDPTDLV